MVELEDFICLIKRNSELYPFHMDNLDYYNELDSIYENVSILCKELLSALKLNTFDKFKDLKLQIQDINASITNSQMYQDYSKYLVRRNFINERLDHTHHLIDPENRIHTINTMKIKLQHKYKAILIEQSNQLKSSLEASHDEALRQREDELRQREDEIKDLKTRLEQSNNSPPPLVIEEVKSAPQLNTQQNNMVKDDCYQYISYNNDIKLLIEQYYEEFFEETVSVDLKFSLFLDMKIEEHRQLLSFLASKRLPPIKLIHISNVAENDPVLRCFLMTSFPKSVRIFGFNLLSAQEKLNLDFYGEALAKCLSCVTQEVFLNNLILTSSDFTKVVESSRNSKSLILHCCIINPLTPYIINNVDYSINLFGFEYSTFSYINGVDNDKRTMELLQSILDSNLSESLQTISISRKKFSEAKLLQLVNQNGIDCGKIKIKSLGLKVSDS